jgi:hypothetical protein
MPHYQVKYKVNSRTYNSDIESPSLDNVKSLFSDLTVAKILEIKEYLYTNTPDNFDNPNYVGYMTFYINFKDRPSIKINIPKFKKNKTSDDVISILKTMYKNIDSINHYSYA